jgi:hypothetical protein
MSWRLIGKSISMPRSDLRPLCLASRTSAYATLLDLLGRHLYHAGKRFLEPAADRLHGVGGELREFRHLPRPAADGQINTTLSSAAVAVVSLRRCSIG